jgi:hypothetical protein
MKVSTENDNNFGYEKITILVDNIPLIPILLFEYFKEKSWLKSLTTSQVGLLIFQLPITEVSSAILICDHPCVMQDR